MDIQSLIFQLAIPQLEQINDKWNGRCIVCGDSKKSDHKKRFWIKEDNRKNDGSYIVHCYNCGYHNGLIYFVREYFPDVFKNYAKINFLRKRKTSINNILDDYKEPSKPKKKEKIKKTIINLDTLYRLNGGHDAKEYFYSRKFPKIWLKYLYYTDNFQEWVNTILPNKFEKIPKNDRRIVIPFYRPDKSIFAFAGRSIEKNPFLRYITIKIDESYPKIFGLERVNYNRPIYVFEGQLDSLFIPNSLAMGGAITALPNLLEYGDIEDYIIVPDIEPRNPDTCDFIKKAFDLGFKVSLLPTNLKKYGKDINLLIIKGGYTPKDILKMINDNIYQGTQGLIKFNLTWKKINTKKNKYSNGFKKKGVFNVCERITKR